MRAPRRILDAKAARLAAGDLLARHAWTRADLTVRLRRRGALPDVAAEVVADLVTRGYVDDAAFARQWVLSRAARGYGAARLRAELRARGVAGPLIDAALSAIDRGGQLDEARRLARRRLPALTRAAPAKAAVRLRDYLLRRGFPGGVVAQVLRESLNAPVD
ncbi:MAG: regulatory protein RecX [Candidatus Rokuibacteriota bacterium]|nr:MAG: regulatory protein RecX [Candidatus Rokubacteria bacterium]